MKSVLFVGLWDTLPLGSLGYPESARRISESLRHPESDMHDQNCELAGTILYPFCC
jgi:hypothetical protein